MIRQSLAATGAALAAFLFLSCRDAPTASPTSADSTLTMSLSTDSTADSTDLGPAVIHSAYTELTFYDGSRGGQPAAEIKVGMEYSGNRASMVTTWAMTGDGVSSSDKISNQQDAFYSLRARKQWHELYVVPAERNCDLHISARTQHGAWWFLWMAGAPAWESTKTFENSSAHSLQLDPCEPEEPTNNGGGGGDSGGGWIVIETCYYWAHYVGGVLVGTELRYCEYDQIPVAEQ